MKQIYVRLKILDTFQSFILKDLEKGEAKYLLSQYPLNCSLCKEQLKEEDYLTHMYRLESYVSHFLHTGCINNGSLFEHIQKLELEK